MAYKVQDFVKKIPGTGGIISTISERVGCDWHTAKKYITDYPTVKQAYEDECERVNDLAQSTVLKSIKDGNTADAKWWLARKRKQEFGEALDITTGGMPIVVDWDGIDSNQD